MTLSCLQCTRSTVDPVVGRCGQNIKGHTYPHEYNGHAHSSKLPKNMHFPTTSILVLALAPLSMNASQDVPYSDWPDFDCWTCYSNNMPSTPACKALPDFNMRTADPDSLTPQDYSWLCHLATYISWLSVCRSVPSCKDSFITTMDQTYRCFEKRSTIQVCLSTNHRRP